MVFSRSNTVRIGLLASILLFAIGFWIGTLRSVGAQQRWPALDESECPFDVPSGVTEGESLICGVVELPVRHESPDGATIELAVAIFPSTAPDPAPDPLVLIRGGPGESTLTVFAPVIASSVGDRFLEQRDVILVELRGTYYSAPALVCPEWDAYIDERLDRDIRAEEDIRLDLETIRVCYERIAAEEVDLSAFNTVESAADLPAVLKALGYAEFNLFATSAATLTAQHLMRENPDALRSVILDSPLPLDEQPYADFVLGATESLDVRIDACTREDRCSATYPDLEIKLELAVERFNADPVTVVIEHPTTGAQADVVLNGDRVAELIYGLLSDSEAVPALPLLIDMLADGDASLVPTFGSGLFHPEHFSRGLQYSALCAEEINFTEADIEAPGRFPMFENVVATIWPRKLLGGCEFWDVDPLPPVVNLPVSSAVPTLVVAGQFDILPSSYGPAVLEGLDRGQLLTFPGAAHTPTGSSACSLDIAKRFLEDPEATVDTSCIDDLEVRFAVEPFARRILLSEPPVLRLALLLLPFLVMLSYPLVLLWRRVRSKHWSEELTGRVMWLLLAAVSLNLAFVVIFFLANPLEIIYGYPAGLRVASWLPLISLVPVAIALWSIFNAVRHAGLSRRSGLYGTLLAIAAVIFVSQLDWWYLLAR